LRAQHGYEGRNFVAEAGYLLSWHGDEGRDGFCLKIIRSVSDAMSQNVEQDFI